MAQLARVPAAAVPPGGEQPTRRLLPTWCVKPFALLRQAWLSQSELWERWSAAPYKDDGPLRWQRRGETWELDGAQLPAPRKGDE